MDDNKAETLESIRLKDLDTGTSAAPKDYTAENFQRQIYDTIEEALNTARERGNTYKGSLFTYGNSMAALFPDGVFLRTPMDFMRMYMLMQEQGKMARYTAKWLDGGHQDSIHDIGVYAFVHETLDKWNAEQRGDMPMYRDMPLVK